MTYVVDLDTFHGPLDLLLYLVGENQLNIYDIPVAVISDQFIAHIQKTGNYELEDLGSFLLMASYLLNLKAKMLLPPEQLKSIDDSENPDDDPRSELVQQLINYKKYKEASIHLEELLAGVQERVYYRTGVFLNSNPEEIQATISALSRSYNTVVRSEMPAEHKAVLPDGDLDIERKMAELIEILADKPEGLLFQTAFGRDSKKAYIAFFLALLELIRKGKVVAVQEGSFSPVRVNLKG